MWRGSRCDHNGIGKMRDGLQVIDDGVDRTPMPMTGVRTCLPSSRMTDGSKSSATSGTSDNALDRMSSFSFEGAAVPGSGTHSPVLTKETSHRNSVRSSESHVFLLKTSCRAAGAG